jgi:Ala-tRNA(Pro) deacylase
MSPPDMYARLIALLDAHGVRYRLIDHPPEGRTDLVSAMRGHPTRQAAKCLVLIVKLGKKQTRFCLAVVAGDARIDLTRMRQLMEATYVSFASVDVAERLAGSVAGTILPFAFDPALELIVDPALLANDELYFNAARLDRSLALRTRDYITLARPRIERIAAPSSDPAVVDHGPVPEDGDAARNSPMQPSDREVAVDTESRFDTHLDVRFAPLELIDVQALVDANTHPWYNQTLCRINDCVMRLGVVQGEYIWHQHDGEDEFFYVVEGRLFMDLEDRTVELAERQGFSVPRGARHRPRAPQRTVILMVEGAGVVPTGD